jgi:hypothetical protein
MFLDMTKIIKGYKKNKYNDGIVNKNIEHHVNGSSPEYSQNKIWERISSIKNALKIKKHDSDSNAGESGNKISSIFKNMFLNKNHDDQSHDISTDLTINKFEPISLEDLDRRLDWKARYDMKFISHDSHFDSLLETLYKDYFILDQNGSRISKYTTEYFDTLDHDMFYQHQYNNPLRYKIRKRRYNNEHSTWLEIKKKINGKMHKYRTFNPSHSEVKSFIGSNSHYSHNELNTMMFVYYERITLMHKTLPTKITIDINMKVGDGVYWIPFDNLMILELKSNKKNNSDILKILESNCFIQCSISKYCVGMVTLYPNLKEKAVKHKTALFNIKRFRQNIKS